MGIAHILEVNELLKSRIKIIIAEIETEKGKKINRQELAASLGITPPYLSAIISGRKIPIPELMWKLSKVLGCKVDDLYMYEEDGN